MVCESPTFGSLYTPLNETDSFSEITSALSVVSASVQSGLGSASVATDGSSISYDPGAAYNYIAMERAIADSGLEKDEVSNERTGLVMGSGGPLDYRGEITWTGWLAGSPVAVTCFE